jgi:hypothetical protein
VIECVWGGGGKGSAVCGGGEREEIGTQIWMLAGPDCRDSGKVLANAGSREEVGPLAFSLPFQVPREEFP